MSPVRSILDWFEALRSGKKKRGGRARKSFSPKKYSKKREFFRKARKTALWVAALGLVYFIWDLPSTAPLTRFSKTPSIIVKAADGSILGTYGDIYGDYVPYDQLPKTLIDAVVATEDRRFFYHFGVDPIGLARAIYIDIRARKMLQGGSTITQQVAKNLFLTPKRTVYRKVQEAVLAVWLEYKFTKKEILTLYLNRMYLGAGNYGVDAASRRYFGHPARELTLPESAVLVGLLKGPSKYSPTNNPDLSEQRGEQVLVNMQDAGYLTQKETDKARRELKLTGTSESNAVFSSFYFSDWVVEQLPDLLGGPVQEDVVVMTTLQANLQSLAGDVVEEQLEKNGKKIHASQGALLAITPTGAIRAMVGGRDYQESQYNRATQAQRQPGSSFKPFVYLAGIEAGFLPDSLVEDRPVQIGKWSPKNYTGDYQGTMTVAYALAHSINTVAVQVSELVGRGKVIGMARRLGLTSEMDYVPSIALGAFEVNLIEMTQAYAHLASNGRHVQAYGIEEIRDKKGKVLYRHPPGTNEPQLLRPNVVAMGNSLLSGVIEFGTGRGASIGRPAAGKTGTTSDYRDAWFIGYTPSLVTGVWLGNDDNTPMKKVTGGALPATIWRQFMSGALKGTPVQPLPMEYQVEVEGSELPWQLAPQKPQGEPGAAASPFVNPDAPRNAARDDEENHDGGDTGDQTVPLPQSFWDKLLSNGDDR